MHSLNFHHTESDNCYIVQYRLKGAEYSVVQMNKECLEVSFKSTYDPSSARRTNLPLSIDIRLYFYIDFDVLNFLFRFSS